MIRVLDQEEYSVADMMYKLDSNAGNTRSWPVDFTTCVDKEAISKKLKIVMNWSRAGRRSQDWQEVAPASTSERVGMYDNR